VVINKVIESFPELLAQCDPYEAASIVADMIKLQQNRPLPEAGHGQEAGQALLSAIQQAIKMEEEITDGESKV
jgi:hypothetical protein